MAKVSKAKIRQVAPQTTEAILTESSVRGDRAFVKDYSDRNKWTAKVRFILCLRHSDSNPRLLRGGTGGQVRALAVVCLLLVAGLARLPRQSNFPDFVLTGQGVFSYL